ncbi:hypothetical protein YC2023_115224 [Brassica napus]
MASFYVYTFDRCIEILDLEIRLSKETRIITIRFTSIMRISDTKCSTSVIRRDHNSGELLIVVTFKGVNNRYLNNVYKMNLENGNWERV